MRTTDSEEQRMSGIAEYKTPLRAHQARIEAARCLFCDDAPCIAACPTSIDVPQFIRKIGTGNLWGAAKTILEANVLGRSCARVCPVEELCVGACVLNEDGRVPIEIGQLQRFATDHAFARGWRYTEAAADSGRSVGLIGGGPASLAAAHQLRIAGHQCTIYEKRARLGGLNVSGIAPYKMSEDTALEEADWVLGIGGIDVRTGIEVGRDTSLEELEREHDAVFIGVGLGADTLLDNLPGSDQAGIEGAVDFIERAKAGCTDLQGVKRALVVGGGNTALDVVRLLSRVLQPGSDVRLLYRGNEDVMPGYSHELRAARAEGVGTHWHTQPVAFLGEMDEKMGRRRIRALRCVHTDNEKRPLAGTEHTLACDLVVLAIGQATALQQLAVMRGITIVSGQVKVDADGATGRPGVFAGGDCVNGGTEVVQAVQEGMRAAEAIDQYLQGVKK
jgi:glutamate synthase (NADPH/NADH) small chain